MESFNIDITTPGFYDDPHFLAQERKDPDFILEYARFVATKPFERRYSKIAVREISLIAEIINSELVTDGRLGACVDIGMIFSRILEEEGYWNYQVKGSLTIDFPPGSGVESKYFYSWDMVENEFAAAHSWLVAPPYLIADVSIKQQPYKDGQQFLPKMLLTTDATPTAPRIMDVFSPSFVEYVKRVEGVSAGDIEMQYAANWVSFRKDYPPLIHTEEDVSFRYTPVSVGAPDRPFQEMKMWRINNRYGHELYKDVILPKLTADRNKGS